jgi:transposase
MKKTHIIKLTEEEQERLKKLVRSGKTRPRIIRRAHILLLASEGKKDKAIAQIVRCCESTVTKTRKIFCNEGLTATLEDSPRNGRPPKLQGKIKAHLIALATSEPPEGNSVWTMRLLADRLIALELVDFVSDETVRLLLKKVR